MPRSLGIDLGTTNSSAAVAFDSQNILMVRCKPRVMGTQGKILPSCVQYGSSGKVVAVGEQARNAKRSGFVIWGVKRLIGLSYDAAVEKGETKNFSYPIERGPGNSILVGAGSERFSPSHVLEELLREIKKIADNPNLNPDLGGPFERAVISVPAYFKAIRIAPIIEAARQAGFTEVETIAEPTAAAIRYGLGIKREARVLVFDLGGGTLDVTVLQVAQDGDRFISGELGISGNENLGGMDMDKLLCSYVTSRHKLPSDDAAFEDVLLDQVEEAKIRLSNVLETDLEIPLVGVPDITLSRIEIDDVLSELLGKCRTPIRVALRDAGIGAHELDHVVLVGGPTFMPCVRKLLRDELLALGATAQLVANLDGSISRGDFKTNEVSPTECVAQGAALKAAKIAAPMSTMLPEGYGVLIGGAYASAIDTKSFYPIDGEQGAVFRDPNAKHVSLTVLAKTIDQENSRDADVYIYQPVGDFSLSVTPDGNLPEIKCILRVSKDKTLSVTLEDCKTGRTATYDSANVPALKAGTMPLKEYDPKDHWASDDIEKMRATFKADKASWSTSDLEKLVALAMNVQTRAKGHANAKVSEGASKLQLSLTQAVNGGAVSAPELANALREFLFLLLQPDIGLLQKSDFEGYMKQIEDVGRA